MCEGNIDWLTGDLAQNPGMLPDLESNWQPFSSQDDAQPTQPHQSRLNPCFSEAKSHTLFIMYTTFQTVLPPLSKDAFI